MTEERAAEIRNRAVLIARRHVHANQATEKEREAVTAVLRSEGLNEDEGVLFWSNYEMEVQDVRKAVALEDSDWRWRGQNIAVFLLEEGGLLVRDARRPSTETAAKIRAALADHADWQRLPQRRKVEADALAVDGALARLKSRCLNTPLWRDLDTVISTEADRGENDRAALVRAAQVAGRAVLELAGPGPNPVDAMRATEALGTAPMFARRYGLRYQLPLDKKTPEAKAARAAADALCHMLRAAEDGDLAVQVPAAWSAAHRAISEAYDGPARATRINNLQLGILGALPEHYRDALGVDPKIECAIRAHAAQNRSA